MKRKWTIRGSSLAALLVLIGFPHVSPAQALKGANWLRVDHNYNYVTLTDARRVGWNLEYAVDGGQMYGWSANYETLYNNYSIKTIFRLGEQAQPTSTERTALAATSFSCSSINTLMNALDAEANYIRSHGAVGPFTLGNEPNLAGIEWGIDGRAYGRIYQCYRSLRWPSHRHASKPLLAAVPGACHLTASNCSGFFTSMFAAMGSTVDGFAVHAYGTNSANFQSDFLRQANAINQSTNAAVRGKPLYVTEYNPGAAPGVALNPEPNQTYFNTLTYVVTSFNASNANQVKALLYFVDSPDSWTRNGSQCNPAVPTPASTNWWPASLCYRDARRQAWLQAQPQPPPQPLNASVSLSGLPFFMMPGQIQRFTANASNTGTTTWAGGGAGSMFRLGATGANGFVFSAFPQCGGYSVNTLNARVYTCNNVVSGAANGYQVDARAPVSASAATFQVKMVQDGAAWFGNAPLQSVQIGQSFCGTALTQCILRARTDILPFYQGNGWNISCPNRDAIVANWCGIDPGACNALKAGTCAAFNNSCRCSGGIHLGGAVIDTNATFCGYQVCGTNNHIYSCSAGNVWTDTTRFCN